MKTIHVIEYRRIRLVADFARLKFRFAADHTRWFNCPKTRNFFEREYALLEDMWRKSSHSSSISFENFCLLGGSLKRDNFKTVMKRWEGSKGLTRKEWVRKVEQQQIYQPDRLVGDIAKAWKKFIMDDIDSLEQIFTDEKSEFRKIVAKAEKELREMYREANKNYPKLYDWALQFVSYNMLSKLANGRVKANFDIRTSWDIKKAIRLAKQA